MTDFPEYRTPAEEQATDASHAHIRKVLDQAVRDGASCKAAMMLAEPRAVVELWVNRVWDGLREGLIDGNPTGGLSGEDRLAAIILLLDERMNEQTVALMQGVGDA